jgi:hypothetical protein
MLLEMFLPLLAGFVSRRLMGEFLNAPESNGARAGPARRLFTEQLVVALDAVGSGERVLEALEERGLVEDGPAAKPGDMPSGVAREEEPPSHGDLSKEGITTAAAGSLRRTTTSTGATPAAKSSKMVAVVAPPSNASMERIAAPRSSAPV